MAGFIFLMDSEESLKKCIRNGYYSTNLASPNNRWAAYHEGTFADYLSMKSGDNIYFFMQRKIFGIGELFDISEGDCKFLNYPNASLPTNQNFNEIQNVMILNNDEECIDNRFICFFRPSPKMFTDGVDMDDALSSNPQSFRMLRALWKRSFIKIDDEENLALRDIILKRNEEFIDLDARTFPVEDSLHNRARMLITQSYLLSSKYFLSSSSNLDQIRHEMALEAGIIDEIIKNPDSIFGNWNYISHQVIASPLKPIDYIDKIDIFGYRRIRNYSTISKYLVIELKRGIANEAVVDQTMKYVDWVNHEYAFDDYSMIEAFIVAYDFPEAVIARKNEVCVRNFIKIRRPATTETWRGVRLISYKYREENQSIEFTEIT